MWRWSGRVRCRDLGVWVKGYFGDRVLKSFGVKVFAEGVNVVGCVSSGFKLIVPWFRVEGWVSELGV